MNNPIQKWHDVVKLRDYNTLTEILHDDAIFYSPVVYTPQKGKDITLKYSNLGSSDTEIFKKMANNIFA